jgi:hypothetical protein
MTPALTVFQGRAGDHNDRGFSGAPAIGAEWQRRLRLTAATIGHTGTAVEHRLAE